MIEKEKQQGKLLQFISDRHGLNVRADRSSLHTVRVRLAVAVGTKLKVLLLGDVLQVLECYTCPMCKL